MGRASTERLPARLSHGLSKPDSGGLAVVQLASAPPVIDMRIQICLDVPLQRLLRFCAPRWTLNLALRAVVLFHDRPFFSQTH